MRTALIIVSLSCILYASAQESAVPEDGSYDGTEDHLYELDDELAEARATVDSMTSAGKSYADCEKLVTDTKTDISTSVGTNQKIIDALPRGEHCPTVAVQTKKFVEEKTKCETSLKIAIDQEAKARQKHVVFGKRTFSSLKEGDCNTFFTHSSYTTAKTHYDKCVTTRIKAEGAHKQATTTLTAEIAAAAKSDNECLCKTRADHEAAFTKANTDAAANAKAWKRAHEIGCVLKGQTKCSIPATPSLRKPTLSARVQKADCAAKKTGLWPIVTKCSWCNDGNWHYNVPTQDECQKKAIAANAELYTYKPGPNQCRVQQNHRKCTSTGSYGKACTGNVHKKP